MRIKGIVFLIVASLISLNAIQVKGESMTDKANNQVTTQVKEAEKILKVNFLKIDGIESSSTQKGFEDYLQINSWSTGISSYDRNTTVQDFYIGLPKSNASTGLFLALVGSKVIPSMTLVVLDPTTINSNEPKVIFRFIMRNVTVSNFQMSGYDTNIDTPSTLDSVSLRYESGTYEGGEFDKDKKASAKNIVNFSIPGRGLVP